MGDPDVRDACAGRRWRCCAKRSSRSRRPTLARFAPAWQGVDRHAPAGAGVDRLRDVLASLQGLPLAPELWEKDVLPRRLGTYSPYWLDELCASGEVVWVGAGPVGGRSGRVALYFRDDAPVRPAGRRRRAARWRGPRPGARAAGSWSLLLLGPARRVPGVSADELREALWDLVWAGETMAVTPAPPRSRSANTARCGASPARLVWALPASLRDAAAPGPVVSRRGRVPLRRDRPAGAGRAWPSSCSSATACSRVRAGARRGVPGRFRGAVPGAVGTRDARGGPPRLLRGGPRRRPVRAAGAVERLRGQEEALETPLVLATADPAQLYGAGLRWPDTEARLLSRRAGAYLVTAGGRPSLSIHAGGRALRIVGRGEDVQPALEALAAAVRAGRLRKLALDRIDGEPAVASPLAERLVALGFRRGLHDFALAPGDA